jgi:hypothetical protein
MNRTRSRVCFTTTCLVRRHTLAPKISRLLPGSHAAAALHDLLAPLGRTPDQALSRRLRGRRTGDRTPHVAGRNPSSALVRHAYLKPVAASIAVYHRGDGAGRHPLKGGCGIVMNANERGSGTCWQKPPSPPVTIWLTARSSTSKLELWSHVFGRLRQWWWRCCWRMRSGSASVCARSRNSWRATPHVTGGTHGALSLKVGRTRQPCEGGETSCR